MAWTGYNTQDSLESFVQPNLPWSTNSTPFTLAQVEAKNKQIYSEINLTLDVEGIEIADLTASELEILALINDYGTAALLEEIRYNKSPQKNSYNQKSSSDISNTWQIKYENALAKFIKKKQNNSFASFGVNSDLALTSPLFTRDMTW